MKNTFLRLGVFCLCSLWSVSSFSQFSFDTSTADVKIENSSMTAASWNTTYNAGKAGEATVSVEGAEIQTKTSCGKGSKQNALAMSSDSYRLYVSVPAGSTSTIHYLQFNVTVNAEGGSGTHQVWGSTETTFNESKAYKLSEYSVVGYGSSCEAATNKLTLPTTQKIKSICIYGKKAKKVSDNGDGSYTINASKGSDMGSGQSLNYFSFYVWLDKGAQILTYNVFGVDGEIDHTAGTITVTVPYATDLTVAQTPVMTLSTGGTFDTSSPNTASTAITFSSTPNPKYIVTDGENKKTYTVTVNKIPASTANQLKTFSYTVDGVNRTATIDQTNKKVTVTVPYSYNDGKPNADKRKTMDVAFTYSDLAVCDKGTSTATMNLLTEKSITITSESGVANKYDIELAYEAAQKGNSIENFALLGAEEVITQKGDTIHVKVSQTNFDTKLGNWVPATLDISLLATISPAKDAAQNFKNIVKYTVSAEDPTVAPRVYVVIAEVDNKAPEITASTPANGADGVSLAGMITLEFDEAVKLGTGAITLGGMTLTPKPIAGTNGATEVKIPFSGLTELTNYTLNIAAGAFVDMCGNPNAVKQISFKTADGTLHELPYATAMDGDNFAQPAFILGGTYDAEIDTKASTTMQYGAYKLAPGESLSVKADAVGSIDAVIYALGGSRNFSITDETGTVLTSGSIDAYDNNGQEITATMDSSTVTTFKIVNNSASGDIYVPYIYISEPGIPALTEQQQWCK